jgi:glycolate oxidase
MFDGRVSGELERAEELASQIVQLCVELGGSITGEHGVGMEKRQFLSGMFSKSSIDCMHRIRRECDPHEIANRGKMFPDAEAPALSMYGLHPLEKAGVAERM